MERKTFLIFYLFLIHLGSNAQDSLKTIYGVVKEAHTEENIPFVHVYAAHFGTSTNLNGTFLIAASVGDSISFSHINYHIYSVRVLEKVDTLVIRLISKEYLLNDVVIGVLPSEEEFKKKILETRILPPKEKINADANMINTRKLFLSGFVPTMNSTDNYKEYIKGPQGVSIFSSDPSKGLIKSFRNISRYNSLFRSDTQNTGTSDSLWLNFRIRRDTIPKQDIPDD